MGNAKSIANAKTEDDGYVIITKDGRRLVKNIVKNLNTMLLSRHNSEYCSIVYGYSDAAKAFLIRAYAEAALKKQDVNVEEIIGFAGDRHTKIYEEIYDTIADTVRYY